MLKGIDSKKKYDDKNSIIHWYDANDGLVVLLDDQDEYHICTEQMWEYDKFFKDMVYVEHI